MQRSNFTDSGSIRLRFLKSFPSGGFMTFTVASTTSSPKNDEVVRWYVISSGKRSTLFEYLFLKWLWDELTSKEWRFILSLPEFFSSKEFIACARALAIGVPKSEIRTRLNGYRTLVGLKPHSRNRYVSMKSIRYDFDEIVLTVQPAKKFSGWVRNHNDHGSLRKSSIFELQPSGFTNNVEVDLFNILSVGSVTILGKEVYLSPDDVSKKRRNGIPR